MIICMFKQIMEAIPKRETVRLVVGLVQIYKDICSKEYYIENEFALEGCFLYD